MYDYTTLKMGEYVLIITDDNKISPAIKMDGEKNIIIPSSENEPKEVIHYCHLDSFKNIIKTNLFWMSCLNNVNDKKEGKWFIELLKETVSSNFKIDKSQRDVITALIYVILLNLQNAYATCFTTLKDNFEKWEVYGDKGRGISIIINPKKLSITRGLPIRSQLASSEEICAFVKMNYNLKEQQDIIKKYIQMAIINPQIRYNVATFLSKLAYTCKRNNFHTENEWRVLFTPLEYLKGYTIPNTNSFSICEYFMHDNKKYYGFYLPKDMISEIIIGPNASTTKDEIYQFLSKYNHNIDAIKVYKSAI